MNIFTKHPSSVDETYLGHMATASKMGFLFLASSVFQFVHAVFPFIHPPFGTDVKSLSNVVIKRALKIEKKQRGKNS
jgi:hypothetical protein